MTVKGLKVIFAGVVCFMFLANAQEAPVGSPVSMNKKEQKAIEDLKGKISGKIVWSSSRSHSKHDIWIMNADGSDQKALTNSPDNVDWFPRISPNGSTVLFTRSKSGWVPESDAEMFDKWDLWTVGIDGAGETKVVESAAWGTWRPSGDSIVFARGSKVFIKRLGSADEKEIFNAETVFKKGTFAQQPEMSPNGKFLALTLRGTTRQTAIWNFDKKESYPLAGGCEASWFPSNKRVLRMNEGQGNGSTEVLAFDLDDNGKPLAIPSGLSIDKKFRFMDLPGRRSHEYFPTIEQKSGEWMVWGATQMGHEHDIANYQLFIWKIGTDPQSAVRLTFHTGNDRWPDIYLN